jgi:stearoyl-CoA desaturase (delta-9 desaturase)
VAEREKLAMLLEKSAVLNTVYTMRQELSRLWERSTLSADELLKELQDWCARAEASGIEALQSFAKSLRRAALA